MKTRTNQPVFYDNGQRVDDKKLKAISLDDFRLELDGGELYFWFPKGIVPVARINLRFGGGRNYITICPITEFNSMLDNQGNDITIQDFISMGGTEDSGMDNLCSGWSINADDSEQSYLCIDGSYLEGMIDFPDLEVISYLPCFIKSEK